MGVVYLRRLLIWASIAIPALAGEYATLSTGFRLYVERHETAGDRVRLYTGQGVTELPVSQVLAFEPEDAVPPPSPPFSAAPKESPSPKELVTQAALRHGLPPEFVHSVAATESSYRQQAVSPKGAVGVMQLMPATARELQADPSDVGQNIDAGVRYLRDLLVKYQNDDYQVRKALAGYNAGPGAVDRHNGIPPYPETQRFVEKVIRRHKRLAAEPAVH